MNTKVMFSSETDMWETPQAFFDKLNAEFNFTLDACAIPSNAKCTHFFTPEQDGLKQTWGGAYMVQPALWTRHRCMGAKSIPECTGRRSGSDAITGQDRHKMVSRLHLRESGNPLH